GADALQDVHVVGDGGLLRPVAADVIVPSGPGEFSLWQHRSVHVQDGFVALVGEGAEQLDLFCGRRSQQSQRLIAMAGEHNMVEVSSCAVRVDDAHTVRMPLDSLDSCVQAYAVLERDDQLLDITLR